MIGVGGFGKVYRGYYRGLEVAVKAARRDADEALDTIKERVLQEGRLFWLLKHQVQYQGPLRTAQLKAQRVWEQWTPRCVLAD